MLFEPLRQLRMLKPKTRENENEENGLSQDIEPTCLYTPTGSVRINNPQENDTNDSRFVCIVLSTISLLIVKMHKRALHEPCKDFA